MLTVKEAKEKWCPMGRVGNIDYRVSLNDPGTHLRTNCVADECMMWRWQNEATGGYCGLAGNPVPAVVINAGLKR